MTYYPLRSHERTISYEPMHAKPENVRAISAFGFGNCVAEALPPCRLWHARPCMMQWGHSIMCHAIQIANRTDQEIFNNWLTAAVSTRQHPSESSGVRVDNDRRHLFPWHDARAYQHVSFREIFYFFSLLTNTFSFWVLGLKSIDSISIPHFL